MTDGQIAYSIANLKQYGIVDSGDAAKLGIGAMTDARVKSFFDEMVKAEIVKPDTDYRKVYTLRFVNKGAAWIWAASEGLRRDPRCGAAGGTASALAAWSWTERPVSAARRLKPSVDMRFRPGLTLLIVIAAVGVLGAAGYSGAGPKPPRPRPAAAQPTVPVTAASVVRQDVPIVIRALGTVQSIQAVNVQSRVNGQIMQAFFKQGQAVKAGDPLFLIDPRPYQAALDQAQAQLQHDQALLAEAQTDLARYQRLVTENSIAQQQAADQAFVVQQDEGTVKLDQANVETAKLNVEYAHINSPAAGIAGAMAVDPGNYVQAGAGTNARSPSPRSRRSM